MPVDFKRLGENCGVELDLVLTIRDRRVDETPSSSVKYEKYED